MKQKKIIVTGAAGLVGQNLLFELSQNYDVVAIDKHPENFKILKQVHPSVKAVYADLSKKSKWQNEFKGAEYLIILHAQISGKTLQPFIDNNITATQNVVECAKKNNIKYIVHVSSSVLISVASDDYTETKRKQEQLVIDSGIPYVSLRPPLMFGFFDRKHLGWLSRFMGKVPFYPIPGNGKYMRQPLYVKDFCNLIVALLNKRPKNKIFNTIPPTRIDYIDIMRTIKRVKKYHTIILQLPMWFFVVLMKIYALFSRDPPFTVDQLKALVAGDDFPVWGGWKTYGVSITPFEEAMKETQYGNYSKIILKR